MTVRGDIGPYRHVTRIAIGGMAEVFRALKRQSAGADRAVVIKRLLPQLAEDPEGCAMFEHEARLGMRIRHPNVVEVLDHAHDGELPYLVLEYVFGVDLRRLSRYLARRGEPMRPGLVAFVLTEMLAGLAAVHDAKDEAGRPLHVVHRDVSPSNVFLSVHGHVKLGDLGIALPEKSEAPRTPPPLRATLAKGKLGYLAPELVAGVAVDARADLFSAGVIAAELLIGGPLFTGASQLAVLLAIRDADVAPLRALEGVLASGFVSALMRALARAPEDRVASASELREALIPFLDAPDAQLRDELGRIVVAALDAGELEEGGVDRASLARTAEHDERSAIAPPPSPAPLEALERALRTGGDRARLFDPDARAETFGPYFEIRAEGAALGPWPYSRIVQALKTAEITGASEARIRGEARWQPVAAIPELARHLPPSSRMPSAHPGLAATSERYDLSAHGGVVPILLDVLRDRASGLLLCERPGVRKEVHVVRGVPRFVSSSRIEELLGETLVAEGVIDRSELHLALAVMPRFEGRIGDTLVALGLVDPLRLVRHIATHAREKLLELLLWDEGHACLHPGTDAPSSGIQLHLDGWSVLEDGMRRRIAAGLERSISGAVLFAQRDELEPPPEWAAVIGRCARGCTIEELERDAGDPARTRAIAHLLLHAGALRIRKGPYDRGRRPSP